MPTTYTTGDLARHFGVPAWQISRTISRGFLPEPQRIGCYRVFAEVELPRVRAALEAAGYLPTAREAAHAG